MKKKLFLQRTLDGLFPAPAIPLAHKDPYTLLVAVVLSAQCTDLRVNQVTPALFAKASTPAAMVALGEEGIRECIRACGLARTKAHALYTLSRQLLERYAGQVPKTLEDLESLAGVGHKTASVVLVQAFGKAAFPVDTHIHRLAVRWGLSRGKNVQEVERDLKAFFPKKSWGKIHLQMILYGRSYCPARGHKEEHCPICLHLAQGGSDKSR